MGRRPPITPLPPPARWAKIASIYFTAMGAKRPKENFCVESYNPRGGYRWGGEVLSSLREALSRMPKLVGHRRNLAVWTSNDSRG